MLVRSHQSTYIPICGDMFCIIFLLLSPEYDYLLSLRSEEYVTDWFANRVKMPVGTVAKRVRNHMSYLHEHVKLY